MEEMIEERQQRLRRYFGLPPDRELISDGAADLGITPAVSEHLSQHNLEWHVIPSAEAVPFDDAYIKRFYPMCARSFARHGIHSPSCREALIRGHARHQGRLIGVETTPKPRYLPGNRQFYGTPYGFDATADPFAQYLGRAGFLTGTRYAHNYASLREFVTIINDEWRKRGLLPRGYRLTVCPPAVFNLVGTIFHPEWSETEALELGFYRDDHGNAKCYAVGSNAPGDFSYIHEIETDADWTLLGFRTGLVPE
ncbi:MAG TPA: hypothetical protein VJZ26_13150 [Blastocatellia bacterium]|nr:hypothetical protein [Blastocatellia bacterium]